MYVYIFYLKNDNDTSIIIKHVCMIIIYYFIRLTT